ncbi:hypothetical protein LP418_11455 [Nocardioides sp. B-3]|nr:hypothetical protein [Nocardioides sp. B-3]UUZ61665.1 hypothetical protein LP418_11455 [Nocardioides sp. B-3]
MRELADRVIEDLTKEGRAATRVHLKVRFAPFFTHTKVRKLAGATMDPAVVADTALALFDALDDDRPVRLLGGAGRDGATRGWLLRLSTGSRRPGSGTSPPGTPHP